MKIHSLSDIKKDDKDRLVKWLEDLESAAFRARSYMEGDWAKVEAALHQQFRNIPAIISARQATGEPGLEQIMGEEVQASDLEYLFYMPLITSQVDGWVGHLRRVGIPVNRQFFRIKFDYHGKLSKQYPFLIGLMEDAWTDFLNTAFHRTKAISKLIRGQKQCVVFGNTALNLDYDKDLGLIDTKVINMMNFALYPPRDDSNKCAMVVKSTIPISELTNRLDIPEDELDELIPESNLYSPAASYHSQNMAGYYATGSDKLLIPFGHIQMMVYFVPHYKALKLEELQGKKSKFELFNSLILVGVNSSTDGKQKPKRVILKIIELDSREYNPMLFCTFGPTLPSVAYDKGKLVQHLPHQAFLNLITSCAALGAALSVDPPLLVKDDGKGTTDTYQIMPGAMWPVNDPNDIQALDMRINLEHFMILYNHMSNEAKKAMGQTAILEGDEGQGASSRQTATEATEKRKSGEVRVDYIAEHQNDNYYQPFVYKYAILSQLQMRLEIEGAKQAFEQMGSNGSANLDDALWDFITGFDEDGKPNCPVFKNFLIYSNIESKIEIKYRELQQPQIDPMTGQPMLGPDGQPIFTGPKEITYRELFEAIVEPLHSTNVIVEGSTSEITKREQRQDFLDLYNFLLGLDISQNPQMPSKLAQVGETIDPKEVARIASKLFNMPEIDLIKPIQEIMQRNPNMLGAGIQQPQEAEAVPPPVSQSSPTELGRAQEIPQVPQEAGLSAEFM